MTRTLLMLAATALALRGVAGAQGVPASRPPGDDARYAAADALADSAPPGIERSVPALAAYLAQAGPDALIRARALYRWITGHISYDVEALRSSRPDDPSPEAVLLRGRAVCEGFAGLATALGEAMGLEIEVVTGWSKGYGYTAGQTFDGPTNHAWNAVRIGGQWRLMDPTWGAGYLDESLRFVRRFQEHYFLTDPAAFVFDHLPADPRWQLLDRPLTAAQYADLVYLRPMFFQLGLKIGNHDHLVIGADDRVSVTLGVSRPVQLSAQVLEAPGGRPLDGEFAFAQAGPEEAQVDARFPRAGGYLLRVFAKPLGAAGELDWILDYRVRARRGAAGAEVPVAYEAFGARGGSLVSPMEGTLAAGRTYAFRLRAPGALEVRVASGGRWTRLEQRGDEWTGDAKAAGGAIVVYARYDAGARFEGLLRYTGR